MNNERYHGEIWTPTLIHAYVECGKAARKALEVNTNRARKLRARVLLEKVVEYVPLLADTEETTDPLAISTSFLELATIDIREYWDEEEAIDPSDSYYEVLARYKENLPHVKTALYKLADENP